MAAGTSSGRINVKGYVLLDKLGSGSYATVYKAHKSGSPHELVAIKCIDVHQLKPRSKENLLTEIKLMKELQHPHIVKMYDFEWDKNNIYIIMEYCSGGDLQRFIHQRRRLPESVARKFLIQLANALQYLHEKGVAHMDLKPPNLLLLSQTDPVLKVSDFGVSQHLNAGEVAESYRGSPLYMAPEIFIAKQYDASVDLWSVGVILYEALFGQAPYASHTMEQLLEKIANEQTIKFPEAPTLSESCRDLLERLLQRDPSNRISFKDFFSHPFLDPYRSPAHGSIARGKSLLSEAVRFEERGQLTKALSGFRSGLEHLFVAMEYEENPSIKLQLGLEVEQYIVLAERVKQILKQRKSSVRDGKKESPKALAAVIRANPALQKAEEQTKLGEEAECTQDFHIALQCYIKAIELMLPVAEAQTPPVQELLKSRVALLITRAEELKAVTKGTIPRLKQKDPNTSKTSSTAKCPIQ